MQGNEVFVLGIAPRSGTNHLADALALHPDFGRAAPFWEDSLLRHVEALRAYVEAVAGSYERTGPRSGAAALARTALPPKLGRAAASMLTDRIEPGRRLVTKTPSVRHLAEFPTWFPDAHAVVLVRDGRAVVESCVRTFGWTYERAMAVWVQGATTIRTFEAGGGSDRYVRVRYEDLVAEPGPTVRRLLEALGAAPGAYDVDALEHLPVRGSSIATGGRPTVHWQPVAKPAGFDRVRWADWDRRRHDRFDWLAGDLLDHFGYPRSGDGSAGGAAVRNRVLDAAVRLRDVIRGRRARR